MANSQRTDNSYGESFQAKASPTPPSWLLKSSIAPTAMGVGKK